MTNKTQPGFTFECPKCGHVQHGFFSVAATDAAVMTRAEKEQHIVRLAEAAAEQGITLYDVHEHTSWLVQTISGNLSRLKARGELIEGTTTTQTKSGRVTVKKLKRGGCTVLFHPKFIPTETQES
jgi:hypothetical protein